MVVLNGFVMLGCFGNMYVYLLCFVLFVLCCGNMCTCIYCVLYCLYCVLATCVRVFTVFCIVCTVFLCFFVYVYLFLFVLSVLVQGLLPPSDDSISIIIINSSSISSISSNIFRHSQSLYFAKLRKFSKLRLLNVHSSIKISD